MPTGAKLRERRGMANGAPKPGGAAPNPGGACPNWPAPNWPGGAAPKPGGACPWPAPGGPAPNWPGAGGPNPGGACPNWPGAGGPNPGGACPNWPGAGGPNPGGACPNWPGAGWPAAPVGSGRPQRAHSVGTLPKMSVTGVPQCAQLLISCFPSLFNRARPSRHEVRIGSGALPVILVWASGSSPHERPTEVAANRGAVLEVVPPASPFAREGRASGGHITCQRHSGRASFPA